MATWQPTFANMCSYQHGPDEVRQVHAEHLAYYGATEGDCSLSHLETAPSWEKSCKSHYRLTCHTYLGWKVYMLHTGCFASMPEWETEEVKGQCNGNGQ